MIMIMRQYSFLDNLLMQFDQSLKMMAGGQASQAHTRPSPAESVHENESITSTRSSGTGKHIAGLMRINHAGEVCAQALYQGQALTARNNAVQAKMQEAADEEIDHLAWCETRLEELGSHTSYLNPLWYIGSLSIGMVAGIAGDRWSLGFVAETERQVVRHLTQHLTEVPETDQKTRKILEQMREDEEKHATTAVNAGAYALPGPVQFLMRCTSKVMTTLAYQF